MFSRVYTLQHLVVVQSRRVSIDQGHLLPGPRLVPLLFKWCHLGGWRLNLKGGDRRGRRVFLCVFLDELKPMKNYNSKSKQGDILFQHSHPAEKDTQQRPPQKKKKSHQMTYVNLTLLGKFRSAVRLSVIYSFSVYWPSELSFIYLVQKKFVVKVLHNICDCPGSCFLFYYFTFI